MRILAVTPYYEPEGGGLERYAHAILGRLARAGHDVRVVTFTRNGFPTEVRDGLRVERLTARLHLGNAPVDPSFSTRIFRDIRSFEPDLVVAHTPVPFPAEMAYLAAQRSNVPFVVTYHAGTLRGSNVALDGLAAIDRATLERRMLAGASKLIAVGPYVRDHALARHKDRVEVIPPGVDTRRFHPHGPASGRSVLFVGPLSTNYRWKGIDVLWDAFRLVRKHVPDARLHLVGAGDRMDEFANRTEHGSSVRIRGRLSDESLVEEYQRSGVVVLPSMTDAESFGMVLAEANACGRPVVGSAIGGIPDFVEDGVNGLLARPGDAADLAQKIIRVLEDGQSAARMGEAGRAKVVRDHDWDKLAAKTQKVFESAVAKGVPLTAV